MTPRLYSATAGIRIPSSKCVRARQFIDPAAAPPTSAQCAVDEVNATSRPSWKIGLMKWMSLQCVLAV